MSPLIPILGGLGLLYLVTRKTVEGVGQEVADLNALSRVYEPLMFKSKSPIVVGKDYVVNFRFKNGTTPKGQADFYAQAKCVSLSSPSVGKFELTQVLQRFTPAQAGEMNLPAMLAAGQRPVFFASDLQVEQIEDLN